MRFKILNIIFIYFIGFSACDIINPPEEIPAYIHIDSFTLIDNYSKVGSLTHNIVDAWVYIDNEFIGTFELPVTFPVLMEGNHKIIIYPGIMDFGIANNRKPYPFYEPLRKDIFLEEKIIDTINPTISYISDNIDFKWKEDFEFPNLSLEITDFSTVEIERTFNPDEVFEKNYSMKATLDDNTDFFEFQTIDLFELPRNKQIYLEVNFKTDVIVSFGYFAVGSANIIKHAYFNFNPSEEWKKIYINLGEEIQYESIDRKYFRLFFGARKNDESDSSFIYFDNFKLISYE